MTGRLQKLISAAGVASRREAEQMILAGRVLVNGSPAVTGQTADSETDEITVDGKPLRFPAEHAYLMLNKPRRYVTTRHDEQNRPTVMDLMKDAPAGIYPVGRLDMYSEGLLLFTNDGAFANAVMHPSAEIDKTYLTEVSGDDIPAAVNVLSAMKELDGETISQASVSIQTSDGSRGVLMITIHEGKNRQVRRMCDAAGLKVHRLVRIAEGSLMLGDLPKGAWRHLTDSEVHSLIKD